ESVGFSQTSCPGHGQREQPRQRRAARQRTVAAGAWRRYTSAVAAWPSPTAVRVGASALTLLAVLIAAVTFAGALRSIGRPWSGFGMLPDASVAPLALAPLRRPDVSRQLAFEDRIVAVDGEPVSGAAQVNEAVARVGEGTPVRYTVRREGVPDRDVTLATTTFTGADYAELFLPLLLGGLVGLALGLVPVLARPDLTAARLFFLGSVGL